MLVWSKETWSDGKTTKTGQWAYRKESDTFLIYLDSGERFSIGGDDPDFGGFKRVKVEK